MTLHITQSLPVPCYLGRRKGPIDGHTNLRNNVLNNGVYGCKHVGITTCTQHLLTGSVRRPDDDRL